MATLKQLLTYGELSELQNRVVNTVDPEKDIKEMTIADLSIISFLLIRTEHRGQMPECNLYTEACNILSQRARKLDIAIF